MPNHLSLGNWFPIILHNGLHPSEKYNLQFKRSTLDWNSRPSASVAYKVRQEVICTKLNNAQHRPSLLYKKRPNRPFFHCSTCCTKRNCTTNSSLVVQTVTIQQTTALCLSVPCGAAAAPLNDHHQLVTVPGRVTTRIITFPSVLAAQTLNLGVINLSLIKWCVSVQ